jgi:hypothetical protein
MLIDGLAPEGFWGGGRRFEKSGFIPVVIFLPHFSLLRDEFLTS